MRENTQALNPSPQPLAIGTEVTEGGVVWVIVGRMVDCGRWSYSRVRKDSPAYHVFRAQQAAGSRAKT